MIVFQADFHEISPEICEIFTEIQEVIANFAEIQQNQWKSSRFCKICIYLDSITFKLRRTNKESFEEKQTRRPSTCEIMLIFPNFFVKSTCMIFR